MTSAASSSLRKILSSTCIFTARPKPPALAWPNRHRACHGGFGRIFLVLLGGIVQRAAEASCITRGKQMFGSRRVGFAWPTHFLGPERSAVTMPSLDSVCPLRPPVAVAVAVKSGLILSMHLFSRARGRNARPLFGDACGYWLAHGE